MAMIEEHLTMQYILIALELNMFQKKLKKFIANKNIITNIYWIQIYNLLMCEYFRIAFNDFMLKDKSLQDCTTLFSPIIKRMIKWYWNN